MPKILNFGNERYVLLVSLTISAFWFTYTQAAEFQLHKIAPNEFERVTSKVSEAIKSDDNRIEILPFDLSRPSKCLKIRK